jgi:hypothetical protein
MWPIGSLLPSDDARLAQRRASRLGPSLAAGEGPNQRPAHFLSAAGVHAKDIVKIRGLASCRCLLLATQSLGVEQCVADILQTVEYHSRPLHETRHQTARLHLPDPVGSANRAPRE